MSEFLDILDNHRELLQERGYDEIGLGSPDEPGLFMKKLEYLFSECIRKSEYNKENQDFFIEAFGFFDDEKDMIAFNFHYEFDPEKRKIEIKSFSARMDGIKKLFFLPRNTYELPYARRVHKMLCDERGMHLLTTPVLSKPDIEKIIQDQDKFLRNFGCYHLPLSHPPKEIYDEIRQQLQQFIDYPPKEIQKVYIDTYIHFGTHDYMKCSFRYDYDPTKADMELKDITAKKDQTERSFPINQANISIVTAQEIYKIIKDAERIAYAKGIAMHTTDKTKSQRL